MDKRFLKLGFDGFKELAKNSSLSKYEKIGFPDSFRAGREADILADIVAKTTRLAEKSVRVLDIGCGCSDLPRLLAEHSVRLGQHLTLVDSREMLNELPELKNVERVEGRFPEMPEAQTWRGKADFVLLYSVAHNVFQETALIPFIDEAARLLAPGGELFIGDLPNTSKRLRFLATETGKKFHFEYMKTKALPKLSMDLSGEDSPIDDSIVLGLLARYRNLGFETFLLPQRASLPMANRREDVLIRRLPV